MAGAHDIFLLYPLYKQKLVRLFRRVAFQSSGRNEEERGIKAQGVQGIYRLCLFLGFSWLFRLSLLLERFCRYLFLLDFRSLLKLGGSLSANCVGEP